MITAAMKIVNVITEALDRGQGPSGLIYSQPLIQIQSCLAKAEVD